MRAMRRKLREPECGWGLFRLTARGPVKIARFDSEDAAYAEMRRRQVDHDADNLMVTWYVVPGFTPRRGARRYRPQAPQAPAP